MSPPHVFIGLLVAAMLLLLLARFAPNVAARRLEAETRAGGHRGPRMAPERFRRLVRDLLVDGMGLDVVTDENDRDGERLIARQVGLDGLGDTFYAVRVAADPPGEIVDQAAIVELEQTVTALGASRGMLFTPYAINAGGLSAIRADLELVDGVRMRELLREYLPARVAELDGYEGLDPRRPAPTTT